MSNLTKGIICMGSSALLWFLPVPDGLTVTAWHYFALFFGTVLGLVLHPLPMAAVILISTVFGITVKLFPLKDALAAWGNPTIWLVFIAFLFARGFLKTGLGRRIALLLTRAFGDSTLKLAYVLAANDLIISPALPSNTARTGGIMFPIVKSLIVSFDSHPGPTARRIGSFLIMCSYFTGCVTSGMFMTAMVANVLLAEMALKALGIEISWGLWAVAGIVPGMVSLIAIPLFLYYYYPPELKKTPEAKAIAGEELAKMGPITRNEIILIGIFLSVLVLWATAIYTKIDATLVGLLGLSVMLMARIIDWQDALEEKGAWDVFIWLGGIIGLADFLVKFGFIAWFAKGVAAYLVGVPWYLSLILVVVIYFYSSYAFAGMTSHAVALYTGLIVVAATAGVPKYYIALTLAYMSSICAVLTHYGTAPAPLYFGAGYVDLKTWWKLGFLVSILYIFIYLVIGGAWWKFLGLW
ncbi:MAG: DASS family sodium-coupled anion symporter [Negativicutes bacterium]|nr:DASS family sodium-coupled anion symporter [Negativicutes bacterium]